MNTTFRIPLESFNLDEREFERCKVWSGLLKRYSTFKEGSVIDLDKLEKEFKDENLEDDGVDNESGEISLDEEDNENNPLNHSVVQLHSLRSTLMNSQSRCNGTIGASFAPLEALRESDEMEDDFDMQDMLDQTLPILVERNRKWKEAGMINILNTFDEEKIERKVGNWLRINKSILPSETPNIQVESVNDDDDSLHSMDTARYVLSNRNKRSGSCCSTIKSYRLLQSKRDALREKYAFSEEELEQELRRHAGGAQKRNKHLVQDSCEAQQKVQKKDEGAFVQQKSRRKVLNKQRPRQSTAKGCCDASSSSEENLEDDCTVVDGTKFLKRQHQSLPMIYDTMLRTKGRGASSLRRACGNVPRSLGVRRNHLKPRKRASECCCVKDKKLCELTEHLADTSTEDWIVENCDPPNKLTLCENKNTSKSKVEQTETLNTAKPAKRNIKKTRTKTVNAKEKDKEIRKSMKLVERTEESLLESTFEKELKLAIKLSKETFETEENLMRDDYVDIKKKHEKKTKLKTKSQVTNSVSLKGEKQGLKLNTVYNCEGDGENATATQDGHEKCKIKANNLEFEKSTKNTSLPKKSARDKDVIEIATNFREEKNAMPSENSAGPIEIIQQNVIINQQNNLNAEQLPAIMEISPSVIDDISPARLGLKPQPKSLKLKKIRKLTEKGANLTAIRNETFFSQADKICNSTAVANDVIALKKQFSTDSDKTGLLTAARKNVDELDCTIVSSTTSELQPRKLTNATLNGDILLHTPRNRTLAPPQSFSDGVFSITEEHLSSLIGEKEARKFMKYYIGRRRFDANLTVYYRPPRRLHQTDSHLDEDDTESDVDPLEQIDHMGDIYVLSEK